MSVILLCNQVQESQQEVLSHSNPTSLITEQIIQEYNQQKHLRKELEKLESEVRLCV